jgi:simple sugar transport system ATP-binding protein
MEKQAYIELKGIWKKFGDVSANEGIDLQINKGEIHALLGENGSGKTTLMNILTGIYTQDSGSIHIDGKRIFFRTPADSLKFGIGMIHQHANLVEALSVEENIAAGTDTCFWIDRKRLRSRIGETAGRYSFPIGLATKVYQLSSSEKQAVEILKAFYSGVTTLVLDEPTSSLAPFETRVLFDNLLKMKENGNAVVLITHKMNEVLGISDRVTVLRKGKSVYHSLTRKTNQRELTEKMMGRALSADIANGRGPTAASNATPLLEVRGLVVKDRFGKRSVDGVSLTVGSGEIHGIAGVSGNGQKDLCDAIAGLARTISGDILLGGRSIRGMGPRQQRENGVKIGYVPEDRMETGLVGAMSIADNVALRTLDSADQPGIFVSGRESAAMAERIIKKYDINASGPQAPVKNLSGGNIQKVLLGREIEMKPRLLITAYPARGLDVGASDYIFRLLKSEKEDGLGILFVGEDIDILLGLCDRISVMRAGRLVATLDAGRASKADIGAFMTGNDSLESSQP